VRAGLKDVLVESFLGQGVGAEIVRLRIEGTGWRRLVV
jgi:hypothetical protein